MAILLSMRWQGVTLDQYDQVRTLTNFEGDAPAGGKYHVAAFDTDGLRVVDVWESAEQFQAFVEKRLRPVTHQLGITTEPFVEVLPVHNIFAPNP